MATTKELHSSLQSLSLARKVPAISTKTNTMNTSKKSKSPIAESWEDENDEDLGDNTNRPLTPQASTDCPSAPPPTPISPTMSSTRAQFGSIHDDSTSYVNPLGYTDDSSRGRMTSAAGGWHGGIRPDKSDAAARRMIAGALGVRAPKRTEEQKEYDRAMKEKELRRREQEKLLASKTKQESEKAKAAIWAE